MTQPQTSTVPAVRDRLVELITAAVADSVEVHYTQPGMFQEIDAIWLGKAENASHSVPTMKAGRKARQEQYTLPINIEALRDGSDDGFIEAETRVFELLAIVEDILAEDVTLGLAYSTLRVIGSENWDESMAMDVAAEGWRVRVEYAVDVNVRLQ